MLPVRSVHTPPSNCIYANPAGNVREGIGFANPDTQDPHSPTFEHGTHDFQSYE